jgi:two-component system sensor histidine kinase MtrB
VAEEYGSEVRLSARQKSIVVEMDSRRIDRILRNLLLNALEHGEGRPIHVSVAANHDAVAVSVRDHGIGMSQAEAARVFDRFWRADPARARTTGGSGLGLSIAAEDTKLHNGWLQAWGRKGSGSNFRLTLPLRQGGTIVKSPLLLEPADFEFPGSANERHMLVLGTGSTGSTGNPGQTASDADRNPQTGSGTGEAP